MRVARASAGEQKYPGHSASDTGPSKRLGTATQERQREQVAIARPLSTIARALTHSSLYESATLIKLCRGIALLPRAEPPVYCAISPARQLQEDVTPQNCAQAFPDYRDSRLLPDAGGKTARAVPASFCFPSFLRFMARTATIAGTAICLVPRGGKQAAHSSNSRRHDNQVCHALLHADRTTLRSTQAACLNLGGIAMYFNTRKRARVRVNRQRLERSRNLLLRQTHRSAHSKAQIYLFA